MKKFSILSMLLVLSGCQQYLTRSDLINSSAGNAITSNSAMQMVDPWQQYVYDINLETSSERQALVRQKYENGGKLPAASAGPQYIPFPYPVAGTTPVPPDGAPPADDPSTK